MAYWYFTDSTIRPCELARIDAPDSASPSDETFATFWTSPGEIWWHSADVWHASDTVTSDIFATGEWEPISSADVESIKQKIREFFSETAEVTTSGSGSGLREGNWVLRAFCSFYAQRRLRLSGLRAIVGP